MDSEIHNSFLLLLSYIIFFILLLIDKVRIKGNVSHHNERQRSTTFIHKRGHGGPFDVSHVDDNVDVEDALA